MTRYISAEVPDRYSARRQRAARMSSQLAASSAPSPAYTRRAFLRDAIATAAWMGSGAPLLGACGRDHPRIAIVGAGLAGLTAAYVLRKSGIVADVYEAADRAGGRIHTVVDAIAPGVSAELGGEFIDAGHRDLLGLVAELGLTLDARDGAADASRRSYFFGGQHYTAAQVSDEFNAVAQRIAVDATALGAAVDYQSANADARRIDALSMDAYLDQIGCRGWLRDLIETAFVSELGLDVQQQSALNLARRVSQGGVLDVLGGRSRRFVVKGGNGGIVRAIAERIGGQIQFEKTLREIKQRAGAYVLTFDRGADSADEVVADMVVLAIPFSTLREVKLDLALPDAKRSAIDTLGYGTRAKLVAGFALPVWRRAGAVSELLTDAPLQHGWELPQAPSTTPAAMIFCLGGRPGQEVGHDDPQRQMRRLVVGLERAYPGARDAFTDQVVRFHWPTWAHAKGSNACYKPGQWTGIRGVEREPVGQLYFAGEHCSTDYQGTMNGAAQSGISVAETVLAAVRKHG